MITPGRWDTQVYRGAELNADFFQSVENIDLKLIDGKRWLVITFREGGVFEVLAPRGLWIEPERH